MVNKTCHPSRLPVVANFAGTGEVAEEWHGQLGRWRRGMASSRTRTLSELACCSPIGPATTDRVGQGALRASIRAGRNSVGGAAGTAQGARGARGARCALLPLFAALHSCLALRPTSSIGSHNMPGHMSDELREWRAGEPHANWLLHPRPVPGESGHRCINHPESGSLVSLYKGTSASLQAAHLDSSYTSRNFHTA